MNDNPRPKTIKELEQYSEQRQKEVASNKFDAHARKTDALVQKTLEKNQALLEKANALQERLQATNKQFQETQQRTMPAKDALAKRDFQNSIAVPIETKPLYQNTVIQTSNPEDVK